MMTRLRPTLFSLLAAGLLLGATGCKSSESAQAAAQDPAPAQAQSETQSESKQDKLGTSENRPVRVQNLENVEVKSLDPSIKLKDSGQSAGDKADSPETRPQD